MENVFLKYMSQRLENEQGQTGEPGPVITISREYGCYASRIGKLITEKINNHIKNDRKSRPWQIISKEVLEDAARKLDIDPKKIAHIFGAAEKRFMHDLVDSFSAKKYASDANIKRMIKLVVTSYAEMGNVVIIGRAGCIFARHIERSAHFKLAAPYEWRVQRIMERFSIEPPKARKNVDENDERRKNFMAFFKGNKPDCELFDMVFNRSTMTEEEIVETIFLIGQHRKLF